MASRHVARLAMMDLNGVARDNGPELAFRGLQPAPHGCAVEV